MEGKSKYNVLITARHSYVGTALAGWLSNWGSRYKVDFISQRDDSWKEYDFSKTDVVVDVTGIAHVDVDPTDKSAENEYNRVNCDLARETAEYAVKAGVSQFIYMSSMIVYGVTGINMNSIDASMVPEPENFYGRSKLNAETALRRLVGDSNCEDARAGAHFQAKDPMKLALVRSPMVYGPGSKGNYPTLASFAVKTPVFPATKNFRSMIYIEHLCELIRQIIEHGDEGIFCPQNRMPVNTGDMVKLISHAHGSPIYCVPGVSDIIVSAYNKIKRSGKQGGLVSKLTAYTEKVFGDYAYTLELSNIYDGCYQLYPFSRTIWKTEKKDDRRIRYFAGDKETLNNPLVTIITVTKNSARTVSTTIESVLNQTYKNIEYIIMDGVSEDNTARIAKSYEERFAQAGIPLRVFSGPDSGMYDAMNKGIDRANGDLIGIINSDDWYEVNAVERMVDTYRETHFDMFYADLRILKEQKNGLFTELMIKHSRLRSPVVSGDWNHPTTFVTREIYEKYRFKQNSIHDDWDLVLRIRKDGCRIAILNEVLANFRYGGISNQKSIKSSIKRGKERYRIYRDNGFSRLYLFECIWVEMMKLFI